MGEQGNLTDMAKILLIDDEDDLRAFVAIALNYQGHDVTEARSGRVITDPPTGTDAAADFDLIITDIVMPDSEGLETIIAARKAHPAGKIIAISGGNPRRRRRLSAASAHARRRCDAQQAVFDRRSVPNRRADAGRGLSDGNSAPGDGDVPQHPP